MIKLNEVTKRYGKTEILKEIDLQIDKGEHVVLTGPSGCGKSTLLRIIAGLESASGGDVILDGKLATRGERVIVSPKARNLGLVPQDLGLWPSSRVRANILLGRKNSSKLAILTEHLGISHLLNSRVSRLSAGERQRVALARTLFDPPGILLLDEPFSALDSIRRKELYDLIRSITLTDSTTLLTVTHDPGDAAGLGADRVVVIENCRIAEEWRPDQVPEDGFKSRTLCAWCEINGMG